jgi:hypothetical protein
METTTLTIERLMRQGFSDEKLLEMFPNHKEYIALYREFLLNFMD